MGVTGSWGDEPVDINALAAMLNAGVDPKTAKQRAMSVTLRGPVAGRPAPVASPPQFTPIPQSAMPDFERQRTGIEAQLEKLNATPDTSALQAEGRRRGEQANTGLLMALAAQQAGQSFEPIQKHMLAQSMAMREPIKYTGGTVNDQGTALEDPRYKTVEQQAMLERRLSSLDRNQREAAAAAMMAQQRQEALTATEAGKNERAADRNALTMSSKAMSGAGAAKPPKLMSDATINKIAGMETNHAQLQALAGSFQDKYARSLAVPGMGAAENFVGAMVGTPAGEWWSGVQDQQNAALKEMSGMAVTAAEAARFAAAKINPNMPAATIRTRLSQQQEILRLARDKILAAHAAGGYATEGFSRDPAAGSTLNYGGVPGAPAAAAPAGAWSVKVKGQ